MMKNMSFFQSASALARHAGLRNSVISENIANADTPKYLTKRVAEFEDVFSAEAGSTRMKRTRSSHLGANIGGIDAQIHEIRQGADPNGNSVSLEQEMVEASSANSEHERAITLYQHGLKILRLSLGRN